MQKQISNQITERIAEREDTKPTERDIRIYDHISVDAIQPLIDHDSNSWRLQFETELHVGEVAGDGTILIDGEQ